MYIHRLILFICCLPELLFAQNKNRDLKTENWVFRKLGDKDWMTAKIPGCVHTDLMAQGKISDPFLKDNEKSVQWVELADWEYQSSFVINERELTFKHIEINFQNLDTYAKIFINNQLLAETNNQFRIWKFNIKPFLQAGKNSIRIVFESAVKKGKELALKQPYRLPGEEAVHTRKAPYQYGWDWGPRLVTAGIDKINLSFWDNALIKNIQCKQSLQKDSSALLEFICTVISDTIQNINISSICTELSPEQKTNFSANLKTGINELKFTFTIKKVKLWWCNDYGPANLYHFNFMLFCGGVFSEKTSTSIGIRTINKIAKKDEKGNTFYFELNGKPVFVKGANYIPPHSFLNGLNENIYNKLVLNAREANMNMLRVWGGGVYADEAFYKACDENGIMVWQDFMFACTMYPGDQLFLDNVKNEVEDQVGRLRNHPSLALWCGNNEIDEGWHNWGWQKQFSYKKTDSIEIEKNYNKIFEQLIPNILKSEDNERPYIPSSPEIGWGHAESFRQGDSHYWGVWWGMEPFETYEKKVGRFMSEYGFQGMPAISTFKKFMPDYPTKFDSVSFKSHQKHPTGYKTIQEYMSRDYNVPKDFENYIYTSQLLQARGMKIAMEAHRRAKPYCMGTLFWQFNDCWPVTSWSSTDFYGKRKAFYYEAKRAFNEKIISFEENADSIFIYVVTDKTADENAELSFKLMDFKGKIIDSGFKKIHLKSNSSQKYLSFSKNIISTKKLKPSEILMNVELNCNGENAISANYFFVKPAKLTLPEPQVGIKMINDTTLELNSNVLCKDLYISLENTEINLNDNYFDLLPNSKKIVFVQEKTFANKNLTAHSFKVKTLFDVGKE